MKDKYEVPKGVIAVFVGDSVALTGGQGSSIVNIDGENVLGFKRATSEIQLDAIIRDSPGHDVARIQGNVVTLNSEGYEVLNPDAQNVAILDAEGRKILSVRYVNESAMIVSGSFYGKTTGPFWILDGQPISLGAGRVMGEECVENLKGPLLTFGEKVVSQYPRDS